EMKQSVLTGTRSTANFDVLMNDELAAPDELPKVPIMSSHPFAHCAKNVKQKTTSITDCITPYVVVLKPRTNKVAEISGNTYTPGRVDAYAYVIAISTGQLIGGGHVVGSTPDTYTAKANAEYELREKLAQAVFDSIA